MKPLDFSRFPHEVVVDEEVVLSDFASEDASRLEEITQDEASRTYIEWTKEDKTAYIERTTRSRDGRGPRYAIRYNGELVGHLAIFPSPDVLGVIEIGYLLSGEFRGNGIVARTLPIGEGLVRAHMPRMKVGLCINDANGPSKRVAERAGFMPTETISDGDRLYLKMGDHDQAAAS